MTDAAARRIGSVLVSLAVLGVSRDASASYGGYSIDELTLSADVVVLARAKSAPVWNARHKWRRVPTKTIEVWKGSNVPAEIVIEYDPMRSESAPQFEMFGTKHDFVAFLNRRLGDKSAPPVYEMQFGGDGVLPVWKAGDLCEVSGVVTAPHGLRDRGLRHLDLRGVKSHVTALANLQDQKRRGMAVEPMPGEVLSPVHDWSNMRLYSCRCGYGNPNPGKSGMVVVRVETCQPSRCDPATVCRELISLTQASDCIVNLPPRRVDLEADNWTCQVSEMLPCGMERGPAPGSGAAAGKPSAVGNDTKVR